MLSASAEPVEVCRSIKTKGQRIASDVFRSSAEADVNVSDNEKRVSFDLSVSREFIERSRDALDSLKGHRAKSRGTAPKLNL